MQKIYLAPVLRICEVPTKDVVATSVITGTDYDSSEDDYIIQWK